MTTDNTATHLALTDGEAWVVGQMKRTAERIAADLIDLAERISREADLIARPRRDGSDHYIDRATSLQSRILNALPNLPLNGLMGLAATADVMAATETPEAKP